MNEWPVTTSKEKCVRRPAYVLCITKYQKLGSEHELKISIVKYCTFLFSTHSVVVLSVTALKPD